MSDYSDLIRSQAAQGPMAAAGAVDANPDEAARAIQLSGATGVPATSIAGDLEGFERQHRTMLAADLVRGNPQLNAYVQSHPLAAQVSNDDFGALDEFSQGAGQTSALVRMLNAPKATAEEALTGAVEGAKEGFGDQPLGQQADSAQTRLGYAIGKTGWVPLDFLQRSISAIGGAISGGAGGAAKAGVGTITGDKSAGEAAGREVSAMAEYEMMRGDQAHPHVEAAKAAEPWLREGMEPPTGVHPILDQAKAETNAHALDGLERDLKNAQQSQTKERSPQLFDQFVRQHYGDAEIGIHGDAVATLYGDSRAPTPDDGILGWIPGIEDKLAIARETGADVRVPVADWISNVDPTVASGLHDDIRMWPGGITAREASVPSEPKSVVDSPMAQVRSTLGSEPAYAIGDRQITLAPSEATPQAGAGGNVVAEQMSAPGKAVLSRGKDIPGFEEFHNYQMLDETGKPVGEMEVVPDAKKKQLYIANISGLNGMYSNSFGPSLVRDIKRQLKALYPDFETVTGHRVSGAREAAGVDDGHPVVKLDAPETAQSHADFQRIMEESHWRQISENSEANFRPTESYTAHEQEYIHAVNDYMQSMVGDKPGLQVVDGIKYGNSLRPTGMFLQYSDQAPKILWDLFGEDPLGTARHEGIHYLRQYGLITPDEWSVLTKAAKDEDWLGRYGIEGRYKDVTSDGNAKLEEAVAEGYREWAANRDTAPDNPVTGVFQKLAQFWEGLKAKFAEILGRPPTMDDMFERIYSGEVGKREPGTPMNPGAFKFSFDDPREQMEAMKASAAGLDKKTWDRLQKLVHQRYAEDIEAATARAAKEEAKTQTREWKENQRAVRAEVEQTIRQRPDVAADLLLSKGELFGEQLADRPKLLSAALTEEQKASLPRSYYGEEGVPPDMMAGLFGYGSGDALVEKLAAYRQLRGDLSPEEMVKKVTDEETQRQMEQRYGQLQNNIMQEARDQALSGTNLDLMAEELKAAGEQAGTATKDAAMLKAWVKKEFSKLPIGSVSSEHHMDVVGRHGRDAERSLIAGDPAKAVVSLQRKYVAALFAKEARTLEKEVASFDKVAKFLAKREVPSMDPEYTNFAHQILVKVGKPVRRSIQDLEQGIAAGEAKNLEDFVKIKQASLRELPVWPELYDEGWRKDYKALTVDEFRSVRDSVKALAHNGRDELKIYKAGEAADFKEVKANLIEAVKQFEPIAYDDKGKRSFGPIPAKAADVLRKYVAAHMQMETLLNRWDKGDPAGDWKQYVMRDLIDAANQEDAWRKEFAGKLKATDDEVDLNKLVDNQIFRGNMGKGTLFKLNRGSLRAAMLNVGNDSNLTKLAHGYGLDPAEVMNWVHTHAAKEDWEWVQKVWDIFDDIKGRSDTMYRSITGGVAPESIPARAIDTPHGQYRGGYYPVIYHPEYEGTSKKLMGPNPLEEAGYVRATTPAGYTKGRTGYAAPMSLDIDALPNRMGQMLHDTAMRPAVLNASKVFYDPEIRRAVAGHYGTEYRDLMIPYIRDVANNSNFMSRAQKTANSVSEYLRQNMVSTLVGFNPSTVLKHGPTALVQSIHEVGGPRFLKAVQGLFSKDEVTGESNWQFAMQNSLELQRRHRNYEETLSGSVKSLVPQGKFDTLRQTVLKYASMPVAMSDLLSAVPTWSAAYTKAIEEGATHGDAIYDGDTAVRRAHGSTASTNRPGIVRDASPWLTSVYGFFNHILNRQMEMVWKAGDMAGMVKDGEYQKAMAEVPKMAGMVFAYAIAPAVIEQLVAGDYGKDERNESWGWKVAKGAAVTLGASWVGVRDLTSALVSGRDPTAGLLPTAFKTVTDVARDFRKDQPFNKEHAGRMVQDASAMVGLLTGLTQEQEGRTARFGMGVHGGIEHPKGPWGWAVGARYGTLKGHSATFEDWRNGR